MLKIASDFSGVGAFPQALERLKIDYDEVFACDFDYYSRCTYILNFGTENDIKLSKSKEHKKFSDGVKKIALRDKKPSDKELLFLHDANEFAKRFSFYFPFNVYDREIPEESLDIYMTSPPCQSFSISGKRLGKDDVRGILFFNSLEFIRVNKPRYFKFENVKGLLSDDKQDKKAEFGRTFQEWINYLGGKSINGVHTFFPYEDSVPYHIYFQVLNAKHYGIPQNRERIFIIGIRDDADNDFQFPKPFPLEKRLKDVLEKHVDEKYFLNDKALNSILGFREEKGYTQIDGEIALTVTTQANWTGNFVKCVGNTNPSGNGMNGNVYSDEGIAPTLTTNKGEGIKIIGYTRDEKGKVTARHEKDIAGTIHTSTGGGGSTDQFVKIGTWRTHEDGRGFREMEEGICPTIPARAREDGSGQPVIKILTNNSKGFDEAEEEEDSINFSVPSSTTRRGRVGKKVAQTLDTQCNQGIYTKERIRRLTPLECFRLMDFNFGLEGVKNFIWDVSDTQAYKQAGNSICVGVLVELIKKLKLCQ